MYLVPVQRVVVTEGKFKDYWNEIQQSYELGFTLYRLHKNADGTFVTPIRYYDGRVYVLDDVATMVVGDRSLTTDTIRAMEVMALLCKEIEDPLEPEV